MDVLANADRTVILNQRRHDAAIGSASAGSLAEVDIAGLVGEVGDDQNVILSRLGGGGYLTVFSRRHTITARYHFR